MWFAHSRADLSIDSVPGAPLQWQENRRPAARLGRYACAALPYVKREAGHMSNRVIAYDLGTGGIKASLFEESGRSLANNFTAYETVYTGAKLHEQDPMQWWQGMVSTTQSLLRGTGTRPEDIAALSISGHSLGAIPVARDGALLTRRAPIWSDLRAYREANAFFESVDYDAWYLDTGNGFPRELYAIFKIMWYKQHEPETYKQAHKFLGTKDYCNYLLTGRMCTDHSYASGSGVYSLLGAHYVDAYIRASGVDPDKLPEIIRSHDVVGTLTADAAQALGLPQRVAVVGGGVDNACMALGAKGTRNNRVYLSLGSSAWIALVSDKPVANTQFKSFVFAHVIPGMFASATSIFAGGSCLRWVRDNLFADLVEKEATGEIPDAYVAMNELAAASPVGANRLAFNPSMAGGSMIEESPRIQGGFMGLNLSHTRADVVRATMEGVALNLRHSLDILKKYNSGIYEMLVVGGGSKSPFWRQMFADVMNLPIIKTGVDQEAASLGAAALAFYGLGIWKDYARIDQAHGAADTCLPDAARNARYEKLNTVHRQVAHLMLLGAELLQDV
jgi:xylulokinase